MIWAFVLLLFAETNNFPTSPWDNAGPEAYKKPCELIQFFGANGQFAIGGVAFKRSDIQDIKTSLDAFTDTPVIIITFTKSGLSKFKTAQQVGVGNQMPICINNQTVSSPILLEFIEGNGLLLSGGFDVASTEILKSRILKNLDSAKNIPD
jgi:preprotein translocase subunit SecD